MTIDGRERGTCFWCDKPIIRAELGYCMVHVDTQYAMCDDRTTNAMLKSVAEKQGKKKQQQVEEDPSLPTKNDQWKHWAYWVIGQRADRLFLEYLSGHAWTWSRDDGCYSIDESKRSVVTPDGTRWTCQDLVRVRARRSEEKD